MNRAITLILVGLLIAGCIQPQPPAGNNSSNGTVVPPANNTTITPPANNTSAIPPGYEVKDYCQKDSDCVRKNSCCDCGLGQYVNKYNQAPECTGPRCMCAEALSHGECQSDKCVAVANASIEPQPAPALEFASGKGECGDEVAPSRTDTEIGMNLRGAVGGGSVCRTAQGQLSGTDGAYTLNITTRAIPGVAACIMCMGIIPWQANITNYSGSIAVYYDGRKVYPSAEEFCGTSTNGTCSVESDCIAGGCSGQVCQSAAEPPVITTCEYRTCYDAQAFGVSCGCVSGKCRWR